MFIAATTTSSWLVTTLSMTFIHDRFTSSLSPTQAIPCHHKTNVSRVDRHRKGPPELVWQCQAILLQFVLLVILSRQKLKRRTTKRERSGWRQATPSKSVASSEMMYAYRSASVQVIWSIGNVVPIMFLSYPSTLSMPCLKLYPRFSFFRWPIRGQPYCR